jgi:ferric-dicitrate binding protein FerR (iron transport regulator)
MKTKKSIENPDWELIAKFMSNEASSAEKEEVEQWAAQSEQNCKELEKTEVLLNKTDWFFRLKNYDTDTAWQQVREKSYSVQSSYSQNNNPKRIFSPALLRYAAAVLIALLLGATGYYFGFKNQIREVYSEIISAEKQVVNEYVLPDGSVVTLNSNSKLEFPKKFKKNVREVTISGEAFFDVKSDPEKPFIIHAGNAEVKVLGTSFNVCAYPEAETVEVVVEAGTVEVICHQKKKLEENRKLLLNAGEKGILLNYSRKIEKTLNADPNYLAWKTRNLVFDQTPLNEVIQYLNKTYHTDIQFKGKNIEQLVLTAQFEKKSVDFILNVIQLTFDLELTRENETYILSEG